MSTVERTLVAILCADVAGYSRLMSEDEEGTSSTLSAHRKLIDSLIGVHKGRIANTAGDSILAGFNSPVEAMRCAIEIQEVLRARNERIQPEKKMLFRIGVNLGDVIEKDGDLIGDGVNIAARLQSLAPPGGIFFSGTIFDQIEGKLDLKFVDTGEQHVKNISRPVRVYRLADTSITQHFDEKSKSTLLKLSKYQIIGGSLILSALVIIGFYAYVHREKSATLVETLGVNLFPINDYSFSKSDRYLVSAGTDNAVRIWDLNAKSEIKTLIGHTDQVNAVDISSDGKMIVSASDDETVRIWDFEDGHLIKTLTGHTAPVEFVTFSKDSHTIASASDDKTVRLWSAETGILLNTFSGHTGMVMATAFSPDGKYLLSGGRDMVIKMWDIKSGMLLRNLTGHSDYVDFVSFSPDGQYAISTSEDETVKLWDASTGTAIRTFSCSPQTCIHAVFSSNGKSIVATTDDNVAHEWDIASGQQTLQVNLGDVVVKGYFANNLPTISPDGKFIASYSKDKVIDIWKIH